MKKASVLIVVSVLLAALLCLAGCGSSSSGEDTSSSTATTENSDSESNGDNASDDSSSSDSESSDSESDNDSSTDENAYETHTVEKAGLTISLPSEWMSLSKKELEAGGYDTSTTLFFGYGDTHSNEYIQCVMSPDPKGASITDYTEDQMADYYSDIISVDSVEKKELDSGTYYQVKGTALDADNYYEIYEIGKNGYDIRYMYLSYGGKSDTPHLDDFENMVNTAKYK